MIPFDRRQNSAPDTIVLQFWAQFLRLMKFGVTLNKSKGKILLLASLVYLYLLKRSLLAKLP